MPLKMSAYFFRPGTWFCAAAVSGITSLFMLTAYRSNIFLSILGLLYAAWGVASLLGAAGLHLLRSARRGACWFGCVLLLPAAGAVVYVLSFPDALLYCGGYIVISLVLGAALSLAVAGPPERAATPDPADPLRTSLRSPS